MQCCGLPHEKWARRFASVEARLELVVLPANASGERLKFEELRAKPAPIKPRKPAVKPAAAHPWNHDGDGPEPGNTG